jgi:hypothetical protein
MWNGDFYNWGVDTNGNRTVYGAATDPEEDIALSLLVDYDVD